MNLMQSNKTAPFPFSIKYLNLILAPKIILYKTKRYWLPTNVKDTAVSSPPSIQHWFVMMQCFENQGVVCQIKRSQTVIRQSLYTKSQKHALFLMTESNTTMKWLLLNANIMTKIQNTAIPQLFTPQISLVIFLAVIALSDKCESMQSTYGSVDSWKESGVQQSASRTQRQKRSVESNNFSAAWVTQFVLYYDILILRDQLHVCVNVPVFINLVDSAYLRNDLIFGTQCLLLYL